MTALIRLLRSKWLKWTEQPVRLPIRTDIPTERLGSPYGGWIIPCNLLNNNSLCYLIGAGEDISFDLEVAQHYKCKVHIFDPTPRAIEHVECVKENILSGTAAACLTYPSGIYPVYPAEVAARLDLHPFGIWQEDTTLSFFAPQNEAHVSHSLVNLQGSAQHIEVPVRRLKGVMQALGHTHIDLLKLDIEGAEYQVLESVLADGLMVGALCIEYDETANNHLDRHYMQRIEQSLRALQVAGYHIIAKEAHCHNYTLLHESRLPQS
jgi:FkbM family methyltransferase